MAINRHEFEATLPTTDARTKAIETIIDKHIKTNWTRYTKALAISMNEPTPLDIQGAVKELYRHNGWKISFESSQHYNDLDYSIRIEGC